MKKVKLVMFDCDGVIFDSKNANEAYYNTLLEQFRLPKMSDKQIAFVHAHTVDEALVYLTKNTNLTKAIQSYRFKLKYDSFIKFMVVEPTLSHIVDKMHPKLKIAVATNRTNTIRQILKYHKISTMFDFVICSSDVKFPKPKPDMLNTTIQHFNIRPSEAVYIGDSKLDELASYSANIPFIAYNNLNLSAFAHITSLSALEFILSL